MSNANGVVASVFVLLTIRGTSRNMAQFVQQHNCNKKEVETALESLEQQG